MDAKEEKFEIERVGKAYITWLTRPLKGRRFILPERADNTIYLSRAGLTDIHLLDGGNLCLAKYSQELPLFMRPVNQLNYCILFGTDQEDGSVFLTAITQEAYDIFASYGELTFFRFLKPRVTKGLEANGFGPTWRQGDIWLTRLGDSWKEVLSHEFFRPSAVLPVRKPIALKNRRLLETRHRLTGESTCVYVITDRFSNWKRRNTLTVTTRRHTLLTGVISAPDHPTFDVSNGIYAAARTEGMATLTVAEPMAGAD